MADPWSQDGYRCRLEWGHRGARVAAERGDVLVVIDVLRFSTATVTAVQHGGIIYPCAWSDDPEAYAARIGAEAAVRRRAVPGQGRFSLSPQTFTAIEPGTRVVLASPNGATCQPVRPGGAPSAGRRAGQRVGRRRGRRAAAGRHGPERDRAGLRRALEGAERGRRASVRDRGLPRGRRDPGRPAGEPVTVAGGASLPGRVPGGPRRPAADRLGERQRARACRRWATPRTWSTPPAWTSTTPCP